MSLSSEQLAGFIVEAKRHTYAAQGDEASVLPQLAGSKQLEYRNGALFYRDIYYGMSFFAGQETVQLHNRPVWTMVYSGGVTDSNLRLEETASIYAFLRQALMQADNVSIYRGPSEYENGQYRYRNEHEGCLDSFHGTERIWRDGIMVYELSYSGGMLR